MLGGDSKVLPLVLDIIIELVYNVPMKDLYESEYNYFVAMHGYVPFKVWRRFRDYSNLYAMRLREGYTQADPC